MELIASGRNDRNWKQLDISSDSGRPHSVLSDGGGVLCLHYIVHAWPILRFSLGLLLADPVSQGKVQKVSCYQKFCSWGSWEIPGIDIWEIPGISTSGVQKIGFTLENSPSTTMVSPLPAKKKGYWPRETIGLILYCSSHVYVCFWKLGPLLC